MTEEIAAPAEAPAPQLHAYRVFMRGGGALDFKTDRDFPTMWAFAKAEGHIWMSNAFIPMHSIQHIQYLGLVTPDMSNVVPLGGLKR